MFSSLRARLWLSYALITFTALSVVTVILFIYLIRNPILNRQTIERLRAVQLVVLEQGNTLQSVSSSAEGASRTFSVRILVFSQDKEIILDTYAGKDAALSFPRKRILPRNASPLGVDENGKPWLYSLKQLPDGSYLMVASPRPRLSILNIFSDEYLPIILQGGLFALLLSLVVAFFFARWIADPLQKIVIAARALPSDTARPVDASGPNEVQELTRAFNAMIARMQASQKSQRDFVANVSHEMKTPLTSIQGFAQALIDGTAASSESRQQAAQVIYNESGRMHRMVLDLLDLARLDAGTADLTMGLVNMLALLNAVAEKFSPQSLRAGVSIKVIHQSDLPAITVDGDRIAQVFTNLIDNALAFTPRAGLITLRSLIENNEMRISVTDTGEGISEEAQAHIFERFYQADAARSAGRKHGAGLGLAIAHEILQAHGGRIVVHSSLGAGTTFDIFLPLTPSSAHTIT